MSIQTDVGNDIGVRWNALPVNTGAATLTGSAIDRLGLLSAVLAHACGAASGTPDSFSVVTTLHHSDDAGSGFATTGITITSLTADSTSAYTDVNLTPLKQWIKLVSVVAFVNGTSPKVPFASTIILGGSAAGNIA